MEGFKQGAVHHDKHDAQTGYDSKDDPPKPSECQHRCENTTRLVDVAPIKVTPNGLIWILKSFREKEEGGDARWRWLLRKSKISRE